MPGTNPFPPIPDALVERFSLPPLSLLGLCDNTLFLDTDLRSTPRWQSVQSILEMCVDAADGRVDADFLWCLGMGTRLDCLLRIGLIDGLRLRPVRLRCGGPECAADLEFDLPLQSIAESRGNSAAPTSVDVCFSRGSVRVRLPTGADQRNWAVAGGAAVANMVKDLIESMEGVRRLTTKRLIAIEKALGAADPLVNFKPRFACSACGHEQDASVDLEGLLLEAFDRRRRSLIHDVHRLAASYHWAESDIVGLPTWRRQAYLQLVSADQT